MGAAAKLTVLRDGDKIQEISVDRELAIGRDQACVIHLDHRMVSRNHAVVKPVEGGIQVEKRSGFGPLSVNGADCTKAILKSGDVISIGPFIIQMAQPTQVTQMPAALSQPQISVPPSTPVEPLALDQTPFLADLEQSSPAPNPEQISASAEAAPSVDLSTESAPADEPVSQAPSSREALSLDEFSKGIPQSSNNAPEELNMNIEMDSPQQGQPGNDFGQFNSESSSESTSAQSSTGFLPADENEDNTRIAQPAKVKAKLVFAPGAANVVEYEIRKDETSIGRGKNCDIVLNDKKSSRKNALILRKGIQFTVKDLGSSNGTYVNGVKVSEQVLTGDDEVRVGDVYFRFQALSADYQSKQADFMTVSPEPELDDVLDLPAEIQGEGQALDAGYPIPNPALNQTQPGFQNPGFQNGGFQGIPGLAPSKGKMSLVEQFRAMPNRKKIIVGIAGLVILYSLLDFDSEDTKKAPKQNTRKTASTAPGVPKGKPSFEKLSPDQKKFVKAQHTLAFDYYKNGEFDKALYEIAKVFELVDDFEDSREIERYAREGKKRVEDKEEERRRAAEQERIKNRVIELVDVVSKLMNEKKYDDALPLFSEIKQLDPDNKQVAQWEQVIKDHQDQMAQEQAQKNAQKVVNDNARKIYREGVRLQKAGKYLSAAGEYKKVSEVGATDKSLLKQAQARLRECYASLKATLEPVLKQAKEMEDSGDMPGAFKLYEKATKIDPRDQVGFKGMDRIRGYLHQKAKVAYTEAVLAESYSDLDLAQKKFSECLNIAPRDDIYYERAQRKLSRYDRAQEKAQ